MSSHYPKIPPRPRDTLYASPLSEIADFAFDAKVAGVFADMINRSVPGYGVIIQVLEVITQRYAQANTTIYDLGCSLGAASLRVRQSLHAPGCQIIAVDNSPAMLEQCQTYLTKDGHPTPVRLLCDDIRNVPIENASMVILNFTLQFIEPAARMELLQKVYAGMVPGGVVVLSEKLAHEGIEGEELVGLHHRFKIMQGYSELEVSQKRTALEKAMIPEAWEAHRERLQACGFREVFRWFQCLNFSSMLAIK